ncbi:alpha/beta hydrolase [Microtetraspora niveoalba]|uniref:alpha/beta hydrolase n=1 Tax=Microtetraspora niveoalba TaxID=46175 RepID=UPI00082FFB59|nr:alpha/beta hydrolase [Microtetraspora niveoalba]
MIDINSPRLRRTLPAVAIAASLAMPVVGAARPAAVPAPAPATTAPLTTMTPAALAARYAVSRDDIRAAERVAGDHGDRWRAAMLSAMADPARRFLSFDGRDGGRAVEVFGDLESAEDVAVLVPGGDTHLDKYGLLRAGALRLRQALGDRSAVIAWLGYRTPNTVSLASLTAAHADDGAVALRTFVRELTTVKPAARVSLVCHSYGSVVCGRAVPGLDVDHLVLIGSPGVTVDHVGALRTRAAVWAGRGSRDWVARVPHTRVRLPFVTLGFGADPVSPGFGARVFAAGDGRHSDYFKAGSLSLANIARIVSGRPPVEARRAA